MSIDQAKSSGKRALLGLDEWAVIVALVVALAVKFDLLKNVPW